MQRVRSIRRQLGTPTALAPAAAEAVVDPRLAVGAALGSALATDSASVVYLGEADVAPAATALLDLGAWSELRSAVLLVETVRHAATARDSRDFFCGAAKLPVLEAGSAAEATWLAQLGFDLSARLHLPVVLRDSSGVPLKHDLQIAEGHARWSRLGAPLTSSQLAFDFHRRKRERLLQTLTPIAELLTVEQGADAAGGENGAGGVIVAGHLGAAVQARASARRTASLRLGLAGPLPTSALRRFLAPRTDVLVLEEGAPFLVDALAAFAQREGLRCRIRGANLGAPRRIDSELADQILTQFCGRAHAPADPVERDGTLRQSIEAAVAHLDEDSGEPWPLHLARYRRGLPGFASGDPRLSLFRALRELGRPTVIITDAGAASELALRDRLVDARVAPGLASCVAASLAHITAIVEQPGAPLCVALVSAADALGTELPAISLNARLRREVLHVLLVERSGGKDDHLELQLRAAGLQVASTSLDEGNPGAAVNYAASRSGPRALVCYYESKAG